jgi:hypothetical protein
LGAGGRPTAGLLKVGSLESAQVRNVICRSPRSTSRLAFPVHYPMVEMSVRRSMPDTDRGIDRRLLEAAVVDPALFRMVWLVVQHVAALTKGGQIGRLLPLALVNGYVRWKVDVNALSVEGCSAPKMAVPDRLTVARMQTFGKVQQ